MPDPTPRTHTFLFTDIEGSTRRWESARAAMSAALARHDAILRTAIETQGGTVFKTVGDAFCAAFVDPVAALRAALEAQRALGAEDWAVFGDGFGAVADADFGSGAVPADEGGGQPASFAAIRVRMALHSGLAEERDGDFFGPTLNRVARLLSAGHGGQVLLSRAVEAVVGGHLPAGLALRDLGSHRLRDLERAEQVYQLLSTGQADAFPPLRTIVGHPHNLPPRSTSFVGREAERAEIAALLEAQRLVTLTGLGGIGKTRLALEVGEAALGRYPDGVWLVDLSLLEASSMVLPALADVLGLRAEAGRPLPAVVRDTLRTWKALIILDNCEHLLAEAAALVALLLAAGPGLTVLATSRERLAVAAEACLPLDPLPVPDVADNADATIIGQQAAVRLFLDRARAVAPGFAVDAGNAAAVAALCARLDGLPLAIELAAARVRLLTPAEILSRLGQRFQLLAGGWRGASPRQQTLRAAVDWSHDLLAADEQRLIRRLAVFRGGWSLDAVEVVCADEALPPWQLLDLLGQLVDKSLVLALPGAGGTRFRYMETLRAYALEKLAAAGEGSVLRDRLLGWCAGVARAAAAQLEGLEQPRGLDAIERDLDNLRAAMDWALGSGQAARGLQIAADLGHYWYQRGQGPEAQERLRLLLEKAPEAGSLVRARAWRMLGSVAMVQGDALAAGRHFAAAEEAATAAGDRAELARCWLQHAWQAWSMAERARGAQLWQQAATELGPAARSWDRGLLGMIAVMVMSPDEGSDQDILFCRATLRDFQDAGDPYYTALAYNNLGWALVLKGDAAEAVAQLEQGRDLAVANGYMAPLVTCLESLGRAAREAGNRDLARESLRQSLALARRHGLPSYVSISLQHLAHLELDAARPDRAAVLLGAVDATLVALGVEIDEAHPLSLHDTLIRSTSATLGEHAYAQAFGRGRVLDFDQALELGLVIAADSQDNAGGNAT